MFCGTFGYSLGSQCCMVPLTKHTTVTCRLAHYEKHIYICKLFCAILYSTLHNYSVSSVEMTKVLFYAYAYITYTHTHTHIYIYIYIYIKLSIIYLHKHICIYALRQEAKALDAFMVWLWTYPWYCTSSLQFYFIGKVLPNGGKTK